MSRKRGSFRKTRMPKTNRVPRTRCNRNWTEAAFWSWIRSGLRKMSQRWAPIRTAKLKHRRPSQSANKKLKWEYQCSGCSRWFPDKQVHVNHIEPCGKLHSWESMSQFAERLFCEEPGLNLLCEKCHANETETQRMTSKKIDDERTRLMQFANVSSRMASNRGMGVDVRIDVLVEFLKRDEQSLPVFLRWLWNPEAVANITVQQIRNSTYFPQGGVIPHGFWHLMSRMRRRGISPDEQNESIKEWKDWVVCHDKQVVAPAIIVLTKAPNWGLNLLHINSALCLAGLSGQCLQETDGPEDLRLR